VRRLDEFNDDAHNLSGNGILQKLNESNEASLVAVPEHQQRELRLKQKRIAELKNK
jgi:hypothetical protein